MELTGRTYIFFAATLVMLGGAVNHYDQLTEDSADPSMVVTQAAAYAECDRNSLDFGDFRVGCHHGNKDTRVRRFTPDRVSVGNSGGGVKFVSSSSN